MAETNNGADSGQSGSTKVSVPESQLAVEPSLDFVDQMAQFHAAAGLKVDEGCTKQPRAA